MVLKRSAYQRKARLEALKVEQIDNLLSSKVIDSCPINSTRRKIITLNFKRNSAGTSKSVHTTSSVGEPDHNGIVLEINEKRPWFNLDKDK